MLYSLDCFMLDPSSLDASLSEILQSWGDIGESCLYVASSKDDDLFLKLHDHGWLTVAKRKHSIFLTNNSYSFLKIDHICYFMHF